MLANLKAQIETVITESLKELYSAATNLPAVILEIPTDKQHGEFSCNIAMKLAGILKQNPLSLAGQIEKSLQSVLTKNSLQEKIKRIEIKKPGFINFFLTDKALFEVLYQVFKEGDNFGRCNEGKGQKWQIEFVSANPTGPLSVAHARQAAIGDALANILKFCGYDAKKEFYLNDEGNQINILGRSIQCRAREILGEQVDFPEDGYQGDYIRDMAQEFINGRKIKNIEQLAKISSGDFSQFGVDYLLAVIKKELADFGVHFDIWSHQSKIATNKNIEAVLAFLKTKGFVYEKEGAAWFKSTDFGDDKDRVVRKSDGSFTYLAPDIVYHKDKFDRGFTKIINMWGPDHHGYIGRLKAAVAALGHNPDDLEVLIVQLATIFRDGKPLSMSTRRGQYISLREVLTEVGSDAARFFFLMRHIEAHLDFDLELAKKETSENPVYYIQYAHARINSVISLAKQSSLAPKKTDLNLLRESEEIDLIKKIGCFPDIILLCVHQRDPFALVNFLLELANCFHKFYDTQRVISDDMELSSERLALIDAARVVLSNGLTLLGVSAPVKM